MQLICVDLPAVLDQHLTDFSVCVDKCQSGPSVAAASYRLDQLFLLHQPHVAMNSRESEYKYLMAYVDILLTNCLQSDDRLAQPLFLILAEILTSLLVDLVDFLSQPNVLYSFIFYFLCEARFSRSSMANAMPLLALTLGRSTKRTSSFK